MLKKQNLKQEKTKIRKGDLKEKRREDTNKHEKILMNKNFVIEYFDVVPFMKQKQRRNQEKERTRQKQETKESKKERQEGRKKGKKKRDTEKEKSEKGGGQNRLWRKKGRHSQINKKCPF